MATITMTYGSYSFAPNPLFTWGTDMLRDSKGSGIGLRHSLGFAGTFLETSGDQTNISEIISARSGLQAALQLDNQEFQILQDSVGLVSGVYPKISDIIMDEGTWADKASYSFSATWDEAIGSDSVSSFSESWDYEESEDRTTATVDHTISAIGIDTSGAGNNALANAREFVTARTGSSNQPPSHPAFVQVSGAYSSYEGLRTENVDVAGGSFSVSEKFTLSELSYIHTQTSSINVSDGITTVQLDGEIKGLGRSTAAYSSALSGWNNSVEASLSGTASSIYTELGGTATLYVSNPTSESVSKDESAGTLGYSREYTDDAAENLPSGVDSFSIDISDEQPTTLTSSVAIFGRALGNVVQIIGTPKEGTFTIGGSAKGEQGFSMASLVTYVESRIDAIRPLSGNYTTLRLDSQSVTKDTDSNEIQFNLTWIYTKNLSAAKVDGAVDLGS
jgi:hypothetical protein